MSTGEIQLLAAILPSLIALIAAITAYLNKRAIGHVKTKQDKIVAPDAAVAKSATLALQQRMNDLKASQDALDKKVNGSS